MDPDTYRGTPLLGYGCRARSSMCSRMGRPKGPPVGKSLVKSSIRSGFRLLLIVTALAAMGAASGVSGQNSTAPAASTSQPERGAAASPPPPGNPPTIVEWLNQTVRLRDTVQALDRPSSDGKAAGRIRGGAQVKAIGIVAGREWVQIELPDQVLAYIPERGAPTQRKYCRKLAWTKSRTCCSTDTRSNIAADGIHGGNRPRAGHEGPQCRDIGRG